MQPKENLRRAITHHEPEYVPFRRLDGSIASLHRMQYRGSRPIVRGETDRWGVTWSPGTPAGQEWELEMQGYPIHHPNHRGSSVFPSPLDLQR